MRKAALVAIVLLLFTVGVTKTASAANKNINILGAFGVASEGFDDLLVDLGVEFQLVQKFYVRFVINTHFGDSRGYYGSYYPSYYYSFSPGISISGTTLHGLNAYGVYKLSLSKKVNLFAKAGLNFMFYSTYYYNGYIGSYEKETDTTGLGTGVGTGIEYRASDRVLLVLGATYKRLFKEDPATLEWFKYYAGINFRVK